MNENSVIEELKKLKEMIKNAKRMPFSKFVSVDRDEILKRIERIENIMPNEMKKAFFIDKKREEIIESAYREREEIIEKANEERKKILSESDILQEANKQKEEILKSAREEANSIIAEAETYSARLLAKVETVLDKAKLLIQEGKESLLNENTTSESDNQ